MEVAREMIVYPHRRHLIGPKTCDSCNSIGNQFLRVVGQPFLGLWICETPECKTRALSWLDNTTIDNKTLIDELGDWVYVHRSNGKKESGWVIQGDAYQDEKDGPFWVSVQDKHRRSKCVTLSNLRHWNC